METCYCIEVWRDIRGFESLYQVSNIGRVKRLSGYTITKAGWRLPVKERIRAFSLNGQGYYQVVLTGFGKRETFRVHRLVYETFVGPIPEGMQVNHIDENKLNNCVWNLNLMTPKQNTNWATCIERRAKACSKTKMGTKTYETNGNAKPILQFTLDGEFIKEWACARYAIETLGLNQASLSMCVHGRTKSCGGFKWRFA